jgi:hypothetical protein
MARKRTSKAGGSEGPSKEAVTTALDTLDGLMDLKGYSEPGLKLQLTRVKGTDLLELRTHDGELMGRVTHEQLMELARRALRDIRDKLLETSSQDTN